MPVARPPCTEISLTGFVLVNFCAGCLRGDAQRRGKLTVVDLMILRAEHGAGELAGQMRLLGARRRRGEPFERQAELFLKLQMMRKRRLIVGGQRQNERAFAAQFDVHAACGQQLLGKGGPARLAVAAERDQILFAGLGFGAGRKHAGRRIARASASLAAVEQQNLGAGGQPPGNPEPDHAGADNDDARPLGGCRNRGNRCAQRGSLRWYDPDRFDGFDLSRVFRRAAPHADGRIMGVLRVFGKGCERFRAACLRTYRPVAGS